MNDSFTLPTAAAAQDLSVLLGRAARLDDAAAVRLIADSGVLAMYVAVITPKGLLDRGPTVLGLRTTALLEGSFDAVVPIASLQARVDAALTSAVAKHCHVNGVVVLTCGTDGNVIRLLPPLSISDDLLREGLGVIAEALEAN